MRNEPPAFNSRNLVVGGSPSVTPCAAERAPGLASLARAMARKKKKGKASARPNPDAPPFVPASMRAASPASERESVDIGASAPLIPAADAVPARPPSDSSPGETLLAGVAAEVVAPPRPAAPSPERARREHDHPRPLAANRVFSPSRLGPTPRDPKLQSTRPDAPREVENDLEEPLLPASDVGYRSDEDLEAALSPGSPGAVSPRRSERISGSWRDESIVADDDGREFLASARPDDPALDARAPYTRRGELAAIWALGWPMGVSYFCRMAMASTDSVMVGHYAGGHDNPGEYLAAAALSDMITTLMVVPPLAFNQVLNALCGQAVGSGRPKMAGVWLQQSMFWLGITMLPFLAGFFFVSDILAALGFDPTICRLAGTYARWNVFWPIPNGWYQCMRFYFQSVGKPRPAMWNSVVFLFVNAALNWIFVFGGPFRHFAAFGNWRGLGFVGAAVSLSCSRCLQPLTYWLYMFVWRREHAAFWPGWRASEHTPARTAEYLKQAVPLVGTLVFSAVVSQSTTLLVSRLGTDAVAATTAVSTATMVWSGAVNAMFTMVIAVRVGFHLGRGDGAAARDSFWLATALVFAVLAVIVAATLPCSNAVVGLTTSDTTVVRDGARVLPAALVATLLGVLNSLCTGGVFSGQGRQSLVAALSFCLDIPLSIGGVAALVLLVKGARLLDVYWYQTAAALVELLVAYAFVFASDWKKYANDALARQAAR